MSRKITAKITVKGTLKTATPLSVGGTGVGEHVDIELASDGVGKYYIPGTGIAGAMRSWVEKYVESEKFYFFDSRIYVQDSQIPDAIKERRHGISISDETGTVFRREGFFYTRAILPRGTFLPFYVELDVTDEQDCGLFALLIEALEAGAIRLGGCRTRGMGKIFLKNTEINYYDFVNDDAALDLWLDEKPAAINTLDGFSKPKLKNSKIFNVKIHWQPESALMIKSGSDGINTKIMPLFSGTDDNGTMAAPVIPGTSLKGLFRAQAGKIIKTVSGDSDRLKIIDDMFGSTEKAGNLMIDDVYCDADNSVLLEKLIEEDVSALDSFTSENQHVAIDRFTGGGSQEALYNARPVKNSCPWEPISITLNASNEMPEKKLKQELALLKLLIRDFSEGYISVGFGSRRGLGKIADCRVEYGEEFPADEELQESWRELLTGGFEENDD